MTMSMSRSNDKNNDQR